MHVLIVQPPYPPNPFDTSIGISTHPKQTSPDWEDLCLLAHIHKRSRHFGHLLDGRIFSGLYERIQTYVEECDEPVLIALRASMTAVCPVATLLEWLHFEMPDQKVAIFGELPTLFPSHCANLPGQPYYLQGDPETTLRNLLDFFDNEKRLERTKGISWGLQPPSEPVWMESLQKSLSPQWKDVDWGSLTSQQHRGYYEAAVRITRGHSGVPPDYAYPGAHVPFREHDLMNTAEAVQRCSGEGITHFFMKDPPGIWTPERLVNWCAALKVRANTVPWGLQFLPTLLSSDEIEELNLSACRRLEFILPSTDPEVLERYGCVISWKALRQTVTALHDSKIQVTFRYWLGGPDADPAREADQVIKTIEALQVGAYELQPFPVHFDSPLFLNLVEEGIIDPPGDWINYLLHPDSPDVAPIWNMEEGLEQTSQTALAIRRAVKQSPKRLFKRAFNRLTSVNWIEELERRSIGKNPLSERP